MKTIWTIAPFFCAAGLLLAGCKDKAPEGAASDKPFDVSKAASNTLLTSGPLVSFATVEYDRAARKWVAPCFFVARGIRTASLSNDMYVMEYKITYTSGGQEVTKTATTRLSQSSDHVHDANPDSKQYIALSDRIDVSDQIPDEGTTFTGTATLVRETGNTRAVEGVATLPAKP